MASDPQSALHVTTRVGPGHKIEFRAPGLAEGVAVDVFVVASRAGEPPSPKRTVSESLQAMPEGPRSAPTGEEFEREFREEREAWDR